jgi:hypothetical protein
MSEIQLSRSGRPSFDGLIDMLDRLIGDGAVVAGDVLVALDGIELIRLDLRLLLSGIQGQPAGPAAPAPTRVG